jgi:Amidohydrolase
MVVAGQAAFPLVRSVRHKPGGPATPNAVGGQRSLISDETWRRGCALLEHHGLHFDLQTPWWNLDEVVRLARDFPRTLIILNHGGLPADRSAQGLAGWRAAMARFSEQPNVRVKISGIGERGRPWSVEHNRWIVEEIVAMFGADRAMFASNSGRGYVRIVRYHLFGIQADSGALFTGRPGTSCLRDRPHRLPHRGTQSSRRCGMMRLSRLDSERKSR